MRPLIIFILFVFSCSARENSQFTQADKIEITYYNNGDTLRINGMSQRLMPDIDRVLDGEAVSVTCMPTGRIIFYIDNAAVYGLEFSTDATGAAGECQYLMFENKGWKLTYNVGMYLDEEFYKLRKKNE